MTLIEYKMNTPCKHIKRKHTSRKRWNVPGPPLLVDKTFNKPLWKLERLIKIFFIAFQREDTALVLKLQQKLKSLEFEKDKLQKRIENTERFMSVNHYDERAKDAFKVCIKWPQKRYVILMFSSFTPFPFADSRIGDRKRKTAFQLRSSSRKCSQKSR